MAVGRPEAQDHPPENGFTPLEHPVPRLLPHIDGSVLPSLGGFGKHQKQLVVLTWIPALFIGFSQFSDYFLLAQPNGTCVQPTGNHSNWTVSLPSIATVADVHLKGNGTPTEGGGEMLCACKEWKLELQTGLSQNVVTKVTSAHQLEILCALSSSTPPPSLSSITASFVSHPHNDAEHMIDKFPTDLNMMTCVRACVRAAARENSSGLNIGYV